MPLSLLPVLPIILAEGNYRSFKFWFNEQLQDGLCYRDELFYRLTSVLIPHRTQLYRAACQLAQSDPVIVTASRTEYSMWVSLRSPRLADLLQEPAKL
jgi:hypothetical protein